MILFFLILAKIPNFCLEDFEKNEHCLDSLLNQGIVVITFWDSWCKPCLRELFAFDRLKNKLQKDRKHNVIFVGINEDSPRTINNAKNMIKKYNWQSIMLVDNDKKAFKLFKIFATPTTFIIGKDREILFQFTGFNDKYEDLLYKKLIEFTSH